MQDLTENTKNRAAAYKILVVEAVITVVSALLLANSVDIVAAYSVALGGLAFVVPNAFFTRYVFRYSAADSADLAMRWFFIGEAVKLIATVFIFSVCFILVNPINVVLLFSTYILMIFVHLIGVGMISTGKKE